jgi:hypothetical protein
MLKNNQSIRNSNNFDRLARCANSFIKDEISLASFKKFSINLADKSTIDGYPFNEDYNRELCEVILENIDHDIDPHTFGKFIELATVLDDRLLLKILEKKPEMIPQIDNQRKFLNIAVESKSTYTFKILVDHGFSPQKTDKETLSPLALAASNQGFDYLQEYSKILGEEVTKSLILEQDCDGKDALSHAIEGNSYSKTIKFLLDNGAKIGHRFKENLEKALLGKHNETFATLLEKNPDGVSQEDLLRLSNLASKLKNHRAHIFLITKVTESGSDILEAIQKNIADTSEYKVSDIHRICREGNLESFKYLYLLFEENRFDTKYALKSFNEEGRTPLLCALDSNCYSRLVRELLDRGADPERLLDPKNNLEQNHQLITGQISNHYLNRTLGIDSLTLCAVKKEPETLGMILQHPSSKNISSTGFDNCVKALVRYDNLNALVIESFFKNIRPQDLLTKVSHDDYFFRNLVKNGMELAPEVTAQKIKESFKGNLETSGIREVLLDAIEISSAKLVQNILTNFSKADLLRNITQNTEQNRSSETDDERSSLIDSKQSNGSKSYGTKKNAIANFDSDLFYKTSLEKAKQPDSSDSSENAKEVLTLLLGKGFEPYNREGMVEDLANLGISEKDYKPNQSFCSIICSQLSSAFGLIR